MAILEVDNCIKQFWRSCGRERLEHESEPGDLYGLIGPNGAGKTTIFNLITGVYTPDEGTIELEGKEIQGVEGLPRLPRSASREPFRTSGCFKA